MSLWPVIYSHHRGRYGRYEVTVYRETDEDPEIEPIYAQLEQGLKMRWAEQDTGFGPVVMPSWCGLTFADPTGTIYRRFGLPFDETDYLVTIEGPGVIWRGRIQKGRFTTPLSWRTVRGFIQLRAMCGLGMLATITAPASTRETQLELFYRALYRIQHHSPIYFHFDALPAVGSGDLVTPLVPLAWRWDSELAGPGKTGNDPRNDFGQYLQQVEAAAKFHGMRVFHGLDGYWHVRHAAGIGETVQGHRATQTGGAMLVSGWTIPEDQLEAGRDDHGGTSGDLRGAVTAAGTVRLRRIGDANLVNNPFFAERAGDGFLGWSGPAHTTPDPATHSGKTAINLAEGDYLSQRLVDVIPLEGFRVRVSARLAAAPLPGTEPFDPYTVRYQLTLEGVSGTEYYLNNASSWVTSEADISFGGTFTDTVNPTSLHLLGRSAGQDFPEPGALRIWMLGTAGPENYTIIATDVRVDFVDENGDLITDWTVTYGNGSGELVDIEAMPGTVVNLSDGEMQTVTEVESQRYDQVFSSVTDWQVRDRFNQQSRDLDLIETTLLRIAGPNTRLRLGDRHYITNGCQVDCAKGTTQGIWREVITIPGGEEE